MERRNRSDRRQASKARKKPLLVGAAAAAALALAAGAAFALTGAFSAEDDPSALSAEATSSVDITLEESSTLEAPEIALQVEVPDVRGKTLEEAELLLTYAGFVVSSIESPDSDTEDAGTVIRQDPRAGRLVDEGAEVVLTYAREAMADPAPQTHFVVVIDPGHQARSNLELEPIGPSSSVMKEKAQGGATGVTTRIPEYETVLQIAKKLSGMLEDAGVEVVMTRTTNDVDISNRQRAEIANQAGADLFVRIHCDGSGDPDTNGASTLYPAGNSWVAPIESRSREAAEIVQAALVERTGAADRGIVKRDDIAGFNWSKVPSVLVECGFLSNPVEDKLLSGAEYRRKVARGIADGVLEYLEGR